jgi:hypothetical protein
LLFSFSRDRHHRRTKSRSRVNDDRTAPSSKPEQQSQSESILSSSPMTVPSDHQRPTLSSIIEPVIEENPSNNIQSIPINHTVEEENSTNEKKRKKHHHHHHKKHRRHRSKSQSSTSKKSHRSKDNDKQTIVENSTSVIQTQ